VKREKKIIRGNFYILVLFIVLISCDTNQGKKSERAGGTLAVAINRAPENEEIYNTKGVYQSQIVNQIMEGLVKLNPKNLKPEPSLAKKWKTSKDGKSITFFLRDDVYFHDHELFETPRKFNAEDVVFSVRLACTKQQGKQPSEAYSRIFSGLLKGADEFYNGKAKNIEGIFILNGNVTFELLRRDEHFIEKLAQPMAFIQAKEVVESGKISPLIGTGPFIYDQSSSKQHTIRLLKNNQYYEKDGTGNSLPYLDTLLYIIQPNRAKRVELFDSNRVQFIEGNNQELLKKRITDFNSTPPLLKLYKKPILATYIYSFNMVDSVFQDKHIREAFGYALDRTNLTEGKGLIPPGGFKGYSSKDIKRVTQGFNPKKARRLLSLAGFPEGEGFPFVKLIFTPGNRQSKFAQHFAKQIKQNLNLEVVLDSLPEMNASKTIPAGQDYCTITLEKRFATFNSPESFLIYYHSPNIDLQKNREPIGYYSLPFEKALENAQQSTDILNRYLFLKEAEIELIKDTPFLVVDYENNMVITYSKVRNLYHNKMNHYVFKKVFVRKWTKDEWEDRKTK
jgi:ABC-type transport system substrate-binding protein